MFKKIFLAFLLGMLCAADGSKPKLVAGVDFPAANEMNYWSGRTPDGHSVVKVPGKQFFVDSIGPMTRKEFQDYFPKEWEWYSQFLKK